VWAVGLPVYLLVIGGPLPSARFPYDQIRVRWPLDCATEFLARSTRRPVHHFRVAFPGQLRGAGLARVVCCCPRLQARWDALAQASSSSSRRGVLCRCSFPPGSDQAACLATLFVNRVSGRVDRLQLAVHNTLGSLLLVQLFHISSPIPGARLFAAAPADNVATHGCHGFLVLMGRRVVAPAAGTRRLSRKSPSDCQSLST